MRKINLFLFFVLVFFLAADAWANPISEVPRAKARQDVQRKLSATYPDSYSLIETLMNANMEAYDELCRVPDGAVSNRVLLKLKNDYYPSFSLIQTLYKSNMESYHKLNQ